MPFTLSDDSSGSASPAASRRSSCWSERLAGRWLAGLALAAAALLLRWLLDPWLGSRQPFTPAYGLVAVAVWFGGWRTACVTLLTCYAGSAYWFISPRGDWGWSAQEAAGTASYFLVGSLIIVLGQHAATTNRALAQALAQLRRSDARRIRFLALLAHELRNPLAAIGPALELLAGDRIDGTQRLAMGRIARQQVDHMRHLIDDLMDLARIDQGRVRLQRQRLAVADLVADAVAAVRVHTDARRRACAPCCRPPARRWTPTPCACSRCW
jgi:signal transduction histidine kinase